MAIPAATRPRRTDTTPTGCNRPASPCSENCFDDVSAGLGVGSGSTQLVCVTITTSPFDVLVVMITDGESDTDGDVVVLWSRLVMVVIVVPISDAVSMINNPNKTVVVDTIPRERKSKEEDGENNKKPTMVHTYHLRPSHRHRHHHATTGR